MRIGTDNLNALQAAIRVSNVMLIDRLLTVFAPVNAQGQPLLDAFSQELAPLVGATPEQQSNTLLLAIATQDLQIISRILSVTNVPTHIPGSSGQSPYDAAIALFCYNRDNPTIREIFDLVSGRGLLTSAGVLQFARHDTVLENYNLPLTTWGQFRRQPTLARHMLLAYNQVQPQLALSDEFQTDRSAFATMIEERRFYAFNVIFLSNPQFRVGLVPPRAGEAPQDALYPVLQAAVRQRQPESVNIILGTRNPLLSPFYQDAQAYLDAVRMGSEGMVDSLVRRLGQLDPTHLLDADVDATYQLLISNNYAFGELSRFLTIATRNQLLRRAMEEQNNNLFYRLIALNGRDIARMIDALALTLQVDNAEYRWLLTGRLYEWTRDERQNLMRTAWQQQQHRVVALLANPLGYDSLAEMAHEFGFGRFVEALLDNGNEERALQLINGRMQQRNQDIREFALSIVRAGDYPRLIRFLVETLHLDVTSPHTMSTSRPPSVLRASILALRHNTVRMLLERPEISNAVTRQFLLAFSSRTRDAEMFRLLMAHDRRLGSIGSHTQALIVTTAIDFRQGTRALLDEGRARPQRQQNRALRNASRHGDLDFVIRALQMLQVTPASAENEAIRLAASHNHPDVVRVLARDPRTNVHASNNQAVLSAARHGRYEVLVALMQSPRFALAPNDLATAIQLAQPHDQVRGLLEDYQRDPQGTLERVRGRD